MEFMKRLEPLFLLLMMLGAVNWLIVGLFDTNVVTELFGSGNTADVVYVIVGLAAVPFLPRLFDELHIGGGHHIRPTGA